MTIMRRTCDPFHPRERNRALSGGFRADATILRMGRVRIRPRYFIPLSPRVILATFEQGETPAAISHSAVITIYSRKKDPRGSGIYMAVRINPLLRGRFRVPSLLRFPPTALASPACVSSHFFLSALSPPPPRFPRRARRRREEGGRRKRIYNTQCSRSPAREYRES